MRSRSVRMVITATVLATAAWTLTACQSDKTSNAASTTSTTPTTAAAQAPTTGAPAGSTPAPTNTATGTPMAKSAGAGGTTTKAGPAAAGAACTSSQLTVTQKDASVGAGQFYAKLVFTNNASSSCTLVGFPGVSYVKDAGVQAGNPATRTKSAYHTVTLAAHGTAYAVMHDSDGIGGYSKGQCDLTAVQGLRIYPPNRTAALFLPERTKYCAGTSIHPMSIGPVQN